ncbi:phosphate ABC transporter permease subunit PstC [Candidatus Pelagibacter bacterium]|jgi:phosphate transport system permease protein|nr:phosphate ABC transporter permease subunit PstC [Candidatus Pelagibacter bacterium]|tara:strand:- start:262 stop:1641 length:1380 start_codon:yes stop_codon:yes gene_type:complete
MNSLIAGVILILCLSSYFFGRSEARKLVTQNIKLKALPAYYGYYLSLWCGLPALIIFGCWSLFEPTIIKVLILNNFPQIESKDLFYEQTLSFFNGNFSGEITNEIKAASIKYSSINIIAQNSKIVIIAAALIGSLTFAYRKIQNNNKARDDVEIILKVLLFTSSLVAILTTVGIIVSLLFESLKFFSTINIFEFIFGTSWSPQRAFVRDASAITPEELLELQDAFGSVPLFAGTAFIALIAMCVAVPIGLFSGIYLAEYASTKVRKYSKPIIEILAGIPTVVYGFFAALTVGPFFRTLGESLGLTVSSESALAAGLIMGVMIIPYISSLSDDVINSVPQSLREGSYAVGATKSETIKKVVIPAALPGIIGSILLAVSRAIGETMIVVMAAGLAANLTINPLESTTTITTQIVMILVGDQEFDSPKTQAAFALGLTLFIATLILNYIALRVVKKYREKYD